MSRADFTSKMSGYPLSHFLETTTFRKMIQISMPDSAANIHKSKDRVVRSVADSDNVRQLESKSRPNLEKYGFQPSIYEKDEKNVNMSVNNHNETFDLGSTKSQENYCKYISYLLPPRSLTVQLL